MSEIYNIYEIFPSELRAGANCGLLCYFAIAVKAAVGVNMIILGAGATQVAFVEETIIEEVQVTGLRKTHPGLVSSSPIATIDAEEINFQQKIDVERILRDLPPTIPGDNENVNNGTDGIATVDLHAGIPE